MTKSKKFGFAIVFTCLAVLGIHGQRIEITKERFIKAYDPMFSKSENRSRRLDFVREQYFSGIEGKSATKEIIEIVPPDKMFVNRCYDDIAGYRYESVFIGNTVYHNLFESRGEKSNRGWEIKEVGSDRIGRQLWNLPAPLELANVNWFLTKDIVINGQMTDLIEGIWRTNFRSKNKKTQLEEDYRILGEWKYWVNSDELLIRFEKYQGSDYFKGVNLRVTCDFEYDPEIRIEAPITNETRK